MESPAFFFTIFLWCLLLSITGYSIYVGFGPPSKQLRDPFEEHEDQKLENFEIGRISSPNFILNFKFTTKNVKKNFYLTIRGGSRKKIAKKIIPNVPTNKKV